MKYSESLTPGKEMKAEDILVVDHSPNPQVLKKLIKGKERLLEKQYYIHCLPILSS